MRIHGIITDQQLAAFCIQIDRAYLTNNPGLGNRGNEKGPVWINNRAE